MSDGGSVNPIKEWNKKESTDGRPSAIYYDEDAHSLDTKHAAFPHVVSEAPKMLQVVSARETSKSTSWGAWGHESSRGAWRSTRRIGPRSQSAQIVLSPDLN